MTFGRFRPFVFSCLIFILLLTGCVGGQAKVGSSPPTSDKNFANVVIPTYTPTSQSEFTNDKNPTSSPSRRIENEGLTSPLLLAHYMPWYQTPAIRGNWGWHWTMNHFNPDQENENGRKEIASNFYPITGPYDSSDETLLEYQVLLMKLSGIDGVIIDWYGIEDFWDYGLNNESTQKLIEYVKKAGLSFAICYEDQTIKNMIERGHLGSDQGLTHGQEVMTFLDENWFSDAAYLKTNDQPILYVFGNPSYFNSASDWQALFSNLENEPILITEDQPIVPAANSSYPWPPMQASVNGVLSESALDTYLTNFYAKAQEWDYLTASAFPGFDDIYEEAGVGPGRGFLDDQDGKTFRQTLQTAIENNPQVIQLVTWNDYGEGTNIEPTIEYGNRYLEILQEMRTTINDSEFAYTAEDLDLPLTLFNLRNQYKGDIQINADLDLVFQAIIDGKLDVARDILAKYSE